MTRARDAHGSHPRSMVRGDEARARRGVVRLGAEALEVRSLLSGMVAEVATLVAPLTVGPMAASPDGHLWFSQQGRAGGPALGVLTSTGGRSEIALPASDSGYDVRAVAPDSQGFVWYMLGATADAPGSATAGHPAGKVGWVGPDSSIHEIALPTPQETPVSAAAGPDGTVVVAVNGGAEGPALVRLNHQGVVSETPLGGTADVSGLAAAPDGTLWFVDGARIGKRTPGGAVTEFAVPAPSGGGAVDLGNAQLTPDADGNVWFLGLGGVSKMGPDGAVKTYASPGNTITSLARGTDGNLWFSFLPQPGSALAAVPGAGLARMTPAGQTTILPDRVADSGAGVPKMAASSDAGLWLDEGGGKVGRLSLTGVASFTPPLVTPINQGVITAGADKSVSGRVVSFAPTDPTAPATNFSATIAWGDGQTSPGTITPTTGGYDVSGSHRYASGAGSMEKAGITVTGKDGASTTIYSVIALPSPLPSGWQTFPATGGGGSAAVATPGKAAAGSAAGRAATTAVVGSAAAKAVAPAASGVPAGNRAVMTPVARVAAPTAEGRAGHARGPAHPRGPAGHVVAPRSSKHARPKRR